MSFLTNPRKPLKRTGWSKTPKVKNNAVKAKFGPIKGIEKAELAGHESTKKIKKDIQALLRQIVMIRDKKCILYGIKCHHEIGVDDEGIVWQAEHLIERSNSATYADLRLVVLVCKNCHGWKHFKKSNHTQYDKWVKTKLSPERVAHWERCEEDTWRVSGVDWRLERLVLQQELKKLCTG